MKQWKQRVPKVEKLEQEPLEGILLSFSLMSMEKY